MKCESIKFHNDNKVEVDGKILDTSCVVQFDDGEYRCLIGIVYRYFGKIEGFEEPYYWVRGSLFRKCYEEPEYEDGYPIIDNIKCCETDVETWGYGKYYYKFLSDSKIEQKSTDSDEIRKCIHL